MILIRRVAGLPHTMSLHNHPVSTSQIDQAFMEVVTQTASRMPSECSSRQASSTSAMVVIPCPTAATPATRGRPKVTQAQPELPQVQCSATQGTETGNYAASPCPAPFASPAPAVNTTRLAAVTPLQAVSPGIMVTPEPERTYSHVSLRA